MRVHGDGCHFFPCACFLGAVENLFADKHLQSYPGAHPQTYPQRHGKTQGRTRRGLPGLVGQAGILLFSPFLNGMPAF